MSLNLQTSVSVMNLQLVTQSKSLILITGSNKKIWFGIISFILWASISLRHTSANPELFKKIEIWILYVTKNILTFRLDFVEAVQLNSHLLTSNSYWCQPHKKINKKLLNSSRVLKRMRDFFLGITISQLYRCKGYTLCNDTKSLIENRTSIIKIALFM